MTVKHSRHAPLGACYNPRFGHFVGSSKLRVASIRTGFLQYRPHPILVILRNGCGAMLTNLIYI